MKRRFFKLLVLSAAVSLVPGLTSCSSENDSPVVEPVLAETRTITVAGALMQTNPGDGNGGTMVYSVSLEEAKNPDFSINVYDDGVRVLSNRTARLQSSEDGKTLFNIAYTGDNGGTFMKYAVGGKNNFTQTGATVNISQYAGTSPRWNKLFDNDRTGVAVNVTTPVVKQDASNQYLYTRGLATVLALDLVDPQITRYKQYEIPLSEAEEKQGHHIFRLDASVLNKAGNKLIIGTWMRKTNPATGANESGFVRLGSKSVVVDYPSLENPKVITSTVDNGDTSGYRSFNAFLGTDGTIYQATQRGTNGAHILRINQNNDYDNSYVFSLDAALGVTGSYVDAWRYVGDGIAYVAYTHSGANGQGFLARVDLKARTASRVEGLPYEASLSFGQYQGFVVVGDELYVAVTPTGKDGRLYILNRKTGAVTQGAKLVNKAGNHYIGVF
ncbi:hypothetical protein [Bergeyella sp. RCAD1439]|uniref:hypothetical protein n=1 Tax=Bergeyella anatis TaxID=3113737 RepID=UPI002E1945BE|nr:hypothetical protein [Bergeyella sp. RCAD1439]